MSSDRMVIRGCFSSTRAMPCMASLDHTARVGVLGLPSITTLVRGVIALVEQRLAGVVERLLGSRGADDLREAVALPDLGVHPVADRFPQLRDSGGGGVLGMSFPQRFLDRLGDVGEDGEVGLAHAERDDVAPFSLELDGARGGRERGGRLGGQHPAGEGGHFCAPCGGPNLRRSASSTFGGTIPATSPPSRATSRTKRLEM